MYTNLVFVLLLFFFEMFLLIAAALPVSKSKKTKKYSNTDMCDIWVYLFFLVIIATLSIVNLVFNSQISGYLSQENYIMEYLRCAIWYF